MGAVTISLRAGMPLPRERLGATRNLSADVKDLRALREGFGLTQQQMAQLLDVSPGTYYRWETAKAPVPLMAIELMRAWAREEAAEKRSRRKK